MYSQKILIVSIFILLASVCFLCSCSNDPINYPPTVTPTPTSTIIPVPTSVGFNPFTSSVEYDNGGKPSIAACQTKNNFVEIHPDSYNEYLWYHTGTINNNNVNWGPSHQFPDNYIADSPSIAISENNVVVEVHNEIGGLNNTIYGKLGYHVGILDPNNNIINWGANYIYDNGYFPCVAISADGTNLIVVYQHIADNAGALWYREGTVDIANKKINWNAQQSYQNESMMPGISLNHLNAGNGYVLLTHNIVAGYDTGVEYIIGKLTGNNFTYGGSTPFGSSDYSNLESCYFDDSVVVVGEDMSVDIASKSKLFFRSGRTVGGYIQWDQAFTQFDTGLNPSIAYCNGTIIEVHSSDPTVDRLWYSTWSANVSPGWTTRKNEH